MNRPYHRRLTGPAESVNARDKFGKYKKEEVRIVRPAEVSGDELEQLRRKREMLRSMTPEQAMQIIEFHKELDLFEAFALAKKESALIVPNYVHDRIHTEIEAWYIALTGTFVIYEAPDKPFGEKVAYSWEDYSPKMWWPIAFKYTFNTSIPEKFRGKKNCALVVEHPDFDLVILGNNHFELKADENSFHLLENFPKKSAKWYNFDERFRIPVGSPKRKNDSMRRLLRRDVSYVGPVARDFRDFGDCNRDLWRRVYLDGRPSGGYGVAIIR